MHNRFLPIGAQQVAGSWTQSIKQSNRKIQKQITIPSRLIVFAFQYAKLQTAELRRHIGSGIRSDEAMESIFANKLAEIGYALHLGYSQDSVLNGQSPVSLQYKAKDERVFIQGSYRSANGASLLINGTKKYCYPIININNRKDQAIIYLDAVFSSDHQISALHLQDGSIKATILGVADSRRMNSNQDKTVFMGYSNIYTAFTGFRDLTALPSHGARPCVQPQSIPVFVSAIIKYNKEEIRQQIEKVQGFSERLIVVNASKEIDYENLFKNIFKNGESLNNVQNNPS